MQRRTNYKDEKTNYNTKSFKVIEASSYDGAVVVDNIFTLELEILTPYALKGLLLTKKHVGPFLRVLKGTSKTKLEGAIQYYHDQVIEEYDEKSTRKEGA